MAENYDDEHWASMEVQKKILAELKMLNDSMQSGNKAEEKRDKERVRRDKQGMPTWPANTKQLAEQKEKRDQMRRERERERDRQRRNARINKEFAKLNRHIGKTASSFASVDDTMQSWTSAITKSVGMTGFFGSAIGSVVGVMDNMAEFTRTSLQTGFNIAGDIIDFRKELAEIGMGLDDFSALYQAHGSIIRRFGEDSLGASNAFLELNKQVYWASQRFGFFGKTTQEITEDLVDYVDLMQMAGRAQNMGNDRMSSAFMELSKEAAALAKMTGRSQRDIMRQGIEATKNDDQFLNVLRGSDIGVQNRWDSAIMKGSALLGENFDGIFADSVKRGLSMLQEGVATQEQHEAYAQANIKLGGFRLTEYTDRLASAISRNEDTSRVYYDMLKNVSHADESTQELIMRSDNPISQFIRRLGGMNEVMRLVEGSFGDFDKRLNADLAHGEKSTNLANFYAGMKKFLERFKHEFSASIMELFGFTEEIDFSGDAFMKRLNEFGDDVKGIFDSILSAFKEVDADEIADGLTAGFEMLEGIARFFLKAARWFGSWFGEDTVQLRKSRREYKKNQDMLMEQLLDEKKRLEERGAAADEMNAIQEKNPSAGKGDGAGHGAAGE